MHCLLYTSVVGDEAILKSEVEEARMSALYEGRKFDRDPYCVIPEEICLLYTSPGDNAYVDELVFKGKNATPVLSFPFTAVQGRKQKGPDLSLIHI